MAARKKFGIERGRLRLGTVPFVANSRQELDLSQGIPKDFFLVGLIARLRYRVAVTVSAADTLAADAGQNLIERIEISGNHKVFGDWVRMNLQGSHVFQRGQLLHRFAAERTGIPADPVPIANHDISVTYLIPFAPPDIRPEEQLLYLLDPPLWNSLNFFVDWGDENSLFGSGVASTRVLSNFGGGGTPELVITRLIAKLKGDRFKLNPIPIKETFRNLVAINTITDGVVADINVGNFIRNIMLVTGVQATGINAAQVGTKFDTLSDAIYTRVKVKKDDIAVRDIEWVPNQQQEGAYRKLPFAFPTGYNMIEFVEDETVANAFDTRELALQNLRFELTGNLTGAANQQVHIIHTELAGLPVFKE